MCFLGALERADKLNPNLNLGINETQRPDAKQQLNDGKAHIGISSTALAGHIIELFLSIALVCVTATYHSLHHVKQLTPSQKLFSDYRTCIEPNSLDRNFSISPKARP